MPNQVYHLIWDLVLVLLVLVLAGSLAGTLALATLGLVLALATHVVLVLLVATSCGILGHFILRREIIFYTPGV